LGDGRLVYQERTRDFRNAQTAQRAQGQCDLGLAREGGVAAREDEAQLIIGYRRDLELGLWAMSLLIQTDRKGQFAAFGFDDPEVPEPVDRLASGGHGEPRARRRRHAVLGPGLEGGRESVLERILGELKVAKEADQGCQDGAGLRPEDPIESAYGVDHLLSYISGTSISGLISIEPVTASGILEAQAIASSRSLTSMT